MQAWQHIGVISWIIVYNFVTIYGTLYYNQIWYQNASLSHLSVYQISSQSDSALCFDNFKTTTKKKNQETQPIFKGSYLRNAWHNLVEIWNVRWWHWLAFPPQKSFGFVKVSGATYCIIVLPVNNSWVWSWATWHTTLCLDYLKWLKFEWSGFCSAGHTCWLLWVVRYNHKNHP